jgi:hypothetical protein
MALYFQLGTNLPNEAITENFKKSLIEKLAAGTNTIKEYCLIHVIPNQNRSFGGI